MKIPIFDIKFSKAERKQFYNYCDEIFDNAYLTNHKMVSKFENLFAEFCGRDKSILVNSGTSALEVALRFLDVKGREVILPANTFIATYCAVVNAGGIPVICDIDKEYFSICLKDLEKKISSKTAVVIWVHIGGLISSGIMDAVKLCKEKNITLVEDAAHAHGSELNGAKAGSFGRFGCFSHFLTKIMTMGEGGSVVCDKSDLSQLQSLRQFGRSERENTLHELSSSNFKITEFQAALGLVDLNRIEKRIESRQRLAYRYYEKLKDSEFKVIIDGPGMKSSFYKCIIVSPFKINEIEQSLLRKEIPLTGSVYRYPLHQQPVCKNLNSEDYPNATWFAEYHFCPPCFPEITLEQVDYICAALLDRR